MNSGWIKIHRKILDNCIYKDSELLHLFIHCLVKANHKDNSFVFNGQEIRVKRGQFISGRFEISKETKIKISSVYRKLKVLENLRILNIKPNNKYSLISVMKYEVYQGFDIISEHQTEQQLNNNRTTTEQQLNTNKNDKIVNKEKNEKKNNTIFDFPIELTGMISQDQWKDWISNRKENKFSLTQTSIKKQIEFLLRQPDPEKCINESIRNNWKGLFEAKTVIEARTRKFGSDPNPPDYSGKATVIRTSRPGQSDQPIKPGNLIVC